MKNKNIYGIICLAFLAITMNIHAQGQPAVAKFPVEVLKAAPAVDQSPAKGLAVIPENIEIGFAADENGEIKSGNWEIKGKVTIHNGRRISLTFAGGDANFVYRLPEKGVLNISPGDELVIAQHDEVFAAVKNGQANIIDALPDAHFNGQFSLYSRPGHIQSAVSMPSSNYTDSDYYKPLDELDLLFDEERSERIITYCGGGVAASSLAFSLVRAGYSDVAVYMGSLEEWTANSENPMTK